LCGRYQFTAEQSAEILQIIPEVSQRHGEGSWRPGEICPTDKAPVLVAGEHEVHPELYRWGYRYPGNLVINARAETAAEKPMFRESVAARRCVVPSTGFFEWDADKRKYLFTHPGQDALYMAGLYAVRDGEPCYCILTTAANDSIREVHNRMPLVLLREQIGPWLRSPEQAGQILRTQPPMLSRTAAFEEQLRLW